MQPRCGTDGARGRNLVGRSACVRNVLISIGPLRKQMWFLVQHQAVAYVKEKQSLFNVWQHINQTDYSSLLCDFEIDLTNNG